MRTFDVVVVGGGPVGLAAAIAARSRGLATALLERRAPPVDKACGEGILPAGLAALATLGVEIPASARALTGVRYRSRAVVAEADFPGGALGAGVRRVDLHRALLERAQALGAELRFGVAVDSVDGELVRTAAETLRARFVVGADGLRSGLRRAAGLERRAPRAAPRFGVSRHFRIAPWSDRVEVHFGDRAEAYVTPVAADEVGVAILWSGGKGGFDALAAERLPADLAARLAALPVVGRDRGAGPFRQRVRRRTRGALALVGDAGGYVDALTGEGLTLGFEQALALGDALAAGDLALYERTARRLARLPERLTQLALFAALRPALLRRYVAALARDPELFAHLLGALGARRPLSPATLLALAARMSRGPVARLAESGAR